MPEAFNYRPRRLEEASDTLDERACRAREQWTSEEPRHGERNSGPSLAREVEVLDGNSRREPGVTVMNMGALQPKWV